MKSLNAIESPPSGRCGAIQPAARPAHPVQVGRIFHIHSAEHPFLAARWNRRTMPSWPDRGAGSGRKRAGGGDEASAAESRGPNSNACAHGMSEDDRLFHSGGQRDDVLRHSSSV